MIVCYVHSEDTQWSISSVDMDGDMALPTRALSGARVAFNWRWPPRV